MSVSNSAASRARTWLICSVQVCSDSQVVSRSSNPGPGGVGGDPADVHAAAVVLDNNDNVEAAQEDRIDVGAVDREDRVGLR